VTKKTHFPRFSGETLFIGFQYISNVSKEKREYLVFVNPPLRANKFSVLTERFCARMLWAESGLREGKK
jgi:hypothetical protein